MNTIDSLGVYWTFIDPSSNEVYQDEVSGLIFYGYWSQGYSNCVVDNISFFDAIWQGGVDIKAREWEGGGMSNLSIEVKINVWPNKAQWISCIEESLRWFSTNGAVISWCGAELSSPSLDVFCPREGSGSIYAAFCESVGFLCGSGLYEEYRDLDAMQLERFHKKIIY
ncbi:hypothetical protein NG726_24165 [Pseudomonas sp. MOB-449]|nr:hypothetical protein [Pseudomonas sp. MOB-449]